MDQGVGQNRATACLAPHPQHFTFWRWWGATVGITLGHPPTPDLSVKRAPCPPGDVMTTLHTPNKVNGQGHVPLSACWPALTSVVHKIFSNRIY